jgi:hypothetical protein
MDSPNYQEIAKRAYALWEQEGHPHGLDLEHWNRAERELTVPGGGPSAGSASTASPIESAASTAKSLRKPRLVTRGGRRTMADSR